MIGCEGHGEAWIGGVFERWWGIDYLGGAATGARWPK